MEMTLDRAYCKAVIAAVGANNFLRTLNFAATAAGCDLDLYTCSQEWEWIPGVKVIKCRGAKGDLIVHLV